MANAKAISAELTTIHRIPTEMLDLVSGGASIPIGQVLAKAETAFVEITLNGIERTLLTGFRGNPTNDE